MPVSWRWVLACVLEVGACLRPRLVCISCALLNYSMCPTARVGLAVPGAAPSSHLQLQNRLSCRQQAYGHECSYSHPYGYC